MRTIHIQIPDSIEMDDNDLLMLVACSLYEKGRLSLGQAADLTGLSKTSFSELLGKYGVSIFNHPAEDLEKDVENA
jgi:predicted HTH domain antitoxin